MYCMKTTIFNLILAAGLSLMSCSPQSISSTVENEPNLQLNDEHNSQNSLDWSGSYTGVEPCADCEGIRTTLKISEDGNYTLTSEYLGKDDPEVQVQNGKFSWIDGNTIELDGFKPGEGSPYFKVEENKVRHLDTERKTIEGSLANHYVLNKTGNPEAEDIRWEITELYGKPINGNPENYYLIFNSEKGELKAKANCNTMTMPYVIETSFKLTVGDGISTLMACPDSDAEDQLKKALNEADNISVGDGVLTLNKARMTPLAKFKKAE